MGNKRLAEEGKLVEDDFELESNDPVVQEEGGVGLDEDGNAIDPTISTEGFAYASEDEIGMQMDKMEIVGPPAYGSPDPATSAGRLMPLRDHPLSADNLDEDAAAVISEDYGQDVKDAVGTLGREGSHHGAPSQTDLERDSLGQDGYDGYTVAELKDMARDREIEGFSSMNKKELIKAHEKYDSDNQQETS